MIQDFFKFPSTALNMTLLLVPGPEPLVTVSTPDRVGKAVHQDQVFPQIGPAGETFITLSAGLGFFHLKLTQTLRVILFRVLDQSSLGNETFPTVSAGKFFQPRVMRHVNL